MVNDAPNIDVSNRTAWASPENRRPGVAPPPPAAPKAGAPPKPGLVSCAGKIEGRYATTGSFGSFQMRFKSGKATLIFALAGRP